MIATALRWTVVSDDDLRWTWVPLSPKFHEVRKGIFYVDTGTRPGIRRCPSAISGFYAESIIVGPELFEIGREHGGGYNEMRRAE